MPTLLPDRDCFDCTPLLVSVRIEADYIADAWAHYDQKVQLHAIQIAFDVLHHWNWNEPR